MPRWVLIAAGWVVLGFTGCAITHSAVPFASDVEDRAALEGVWEGVYQGAGTGRSGSIYFELAAEADSAVGEVVMTYEGHTVRPVDPMPYPHSEADVLTIRFVRLGPGRVSGTLDPYPDPDGDGTIHTTFQGTIEGDVIEGTFVAHRAARTVQRGTWRVVRQR
jgi:hypothetical protein